MPHLFVNRPRLHDLFSEEPDLRDQFRWETINAVVYKLGGVLFIFGSVFFFPALSAHENLGVWAFILGSLLYLLVTGHDMIEATIHARKARGHETIWNRFEVGAAASYLVGTIFFTVGSVFFLSAFGLYTAGASCFVIGSMLFILGATINVLQIVLAEDLLTLQLMNLTAIAFVVGSVLFAVASVPYLWKVQSPTGQRVLDAFLAWQYVVGSGLFLLGGVFNYWRSWIFVRQRMRA